MDRALLDTDIYSEVLKGKDQTVVARAAEYRAHFGRLTVSTVTVLEIVKGLHRRSREDRVSQFLGVLPTLEILPLDVDAAIVAGRVYADLERAGQPVGRADPMIAGICLQRGLTLVTGNTDHFERIRAAGYALKLDDWRK